MAIKSILKLFVIAILIITTLNYSYADGCLLIGPNQAKTIAQDYINSHNLPYTAITPDYDALKCKVNDSKTGEIVWITSKDLTADKTGRYVSADGSDDVWIVQVNDKNGKNVGQIHVDGGPIPKYYGKILKVTIPQISQTENPSMLTNTTNTTNSTNTTNATAPKSQESGNTGIILGVIILICAIGAGYFMYTKI